MFGFVKVMVWFRAREVSTRRIDRDDSDKLGGAFRSTKAIESTKIKEHDGIQNVLDTLPRRESLLGLCGKTSLPESGASAGFSWLQNAAIL